MSIEMTLEALAKKLQELDQFLEDPEVRKIHVTDEGFFHHADDPVWKKHSDDIDELACGALIGETGGCRWDKHLQLKERWGYRVGPGEQDSFGWLSGIIHGRNFKIAYG